MCEFCLNTARCTINDVSGPDLKALRQTLDDADTQRFLPELCSEFPTADSLHLLVYPMLLAQVNAHFESGRGFFWSIRREETMVGLVVLMYLNTHPTLYFATHPDHRRQGYMKETLLRVIEFARKEYLFPKLYAEVPTEDNAAATLLRVLGFRETSVENGMSFRELELYEDD